MPNTTGKRGDRIDYLDRCGCLIGFTICQRSAIPYIDDGIWAYYTLGQRNQAEPERPSV
jgi:hypothetical protein